MHEQPRIPSKISSETATPTYEHQLCVVGNNREIVFKELEHPGSTELWGILSSGDPNEIPRFILPADSTRWTKDLSLTNNFWASLLPAGSRRADNALVYRPGQTFGQFGYEHSGGEGIPFGHSIQYLRLTPESYYNELALAAAELKLTDAVSRSNDLLLGYYAELEKIGDQEEIHGGPLENPLWRDSDFEFHVVRPIFRRLMEKGFALYDLAL